MIPAPLPLRGVLPPGASPAPPGIGSYLGWRTALLGFLAWLVLLASAASLPAQLTPESRIIHLGDQQFVQRSWSARHGLPVNQVTGILQSEDLYIWLSTFDGLFRFDGIRFVAFNQTSSPELPTARFTGVLGEAQGAIWLRSDQRHLIGFRDGVFQDHLPDTGPLLGFHIDPDGMVWAGSDLGLLRYSGGRFAPVVLPGVGTVTAIAAATGPGGVRERWSGDLWVSTADGHLHRVDPGEGRVLESHPVPWTPGPGAEAMTIDMEGAVWLTSYKGSIRLLDGVVEAHPLEAPTHGVRTFIPPEDGQPAYLRLAGQTLLLDNGRWIHLEEGDDGSWPSVGALGPDGSRWAISGESVIRDGVLISDSVGPQGQAISDHEGSIWIGSITGLHQIRPASVSGIPLEQGGIPHHAYGLHEGPTGTLWITATRPPVGSGLWRMTDGQGDPEFVDPLAGQFTYIEMPVLEARNGDLWVSLDTGGACRLDADLRCPDDGLFPMDGDMIRGIFQDRDGTIWFGAEGRVKALDTDGTWTMVGAEDGLPGSRIRAFVETPEGHLWMATESNGIVRWDGEVVEQLTTTEGLSGDQVRALHLDREGILWVGTEGRGISRVVEQAPSRDGGGWDITSIRQIDGLFDDGVHQILEDDDGRFWMSSNRGLFFVHRTELEAFAAGEASNIRSTGFDERDGLLNRELNGGVHGAGIRTSTGRLIFPGMEGLAVVDPGRVRPTPGPPTVRIEGGIVNRLPVPAEDGVIALPRSSRDVEITFSSLSFWSPQSTVFRYRLRGVDGDWREISGRRSAFYTNLPAGRYTFEILASQDLQNWSGEPVTMDLLVPYRLHEHPVSQAGAGLLFLLGLLGVIRLREMRLQEQARELELQVNERTQLVEAQAERLLEMDRLKSKLFQDISHEFRTPLTLVIAPLENAHRALEGSSEARTHYDENRLLHDVDLAMESAKRLLELVGQILDLTRLEAGHLPARVHPTDPVPWLNRHILSFTPLADVKNIDLKKEVPDSLPTIWSSRDLLNKMVGNLVSNAIKYTPEGGSVRVRAWTDGAFVNIEVRDSGPGIPRDRLPSLFQRFSDGWVTGEEGALPSTGIGLSLTHQLAEFHGGGVDVSSEEGFGSTFTLRLKLGHTHFPDGVLAQDVPNEGEEEEPPTPESASGAALRPSARVPAPKHTGPEGTADPAHAGRPRVLVVEDHTGVRSYLQLILSEAYHVEAVGNGKMALARMASESFDLILSDLRMPEMDGMELLDRIRRDDRVREDGLSTPFVLISARDDRDERSGAYSLGASAFLSKPISPRELLACIDGLLKTQESLRKRRPILKVSAAEVQAESSDAVFLARLAEVAEAHLEDPDFGTSELAAALGYSRSALYRKLGEIGEDTPARILARLRLDRAAQLLEEDAGSVSRIALRCGFRSVSNFSRAFKKEHGIPPSRFVDMTSQGTNGKHSGTATEA